MASLKSLRNKRDSGATCTIHTKVHSQDMVFVRIITKNGVNEIVDIKEITIDSEFVRSFIVQHINSMY